MEHLAPSLDAAATAAPDEAGSLRAWLSGFERVFVLTGAGCSTASGIPDYRDADGQWKRTPPVTYQAFTDDALVNARYWARSFVGWPRIGLAQPNAAHLALARWQRAGRLSKLVTQNVDGLHQRAGSEAVIDLHGRLEEVVCLSCSARELRMTSFAVRGPPNVWSGGSWSSPLPDPPADLHYHHRHGTSCAVP